MKTLGTELPEEIQRCRELVDMYRSIGPNGAFGAMMIQQDIYDAEKAMAEKDTVAMLVAYQKLKECQ